MKGYKVTAANYTTQIFIDDQALEWINPTPKEEENFILGFGKKFHGYSYDKKNIYIKKILRSSEFEDYLRQLANSNPHDNQTSYAIKKAVNEERQNNHFMTDQYRFYFGLGEDNGKLAYPGRDQPQFFIVGEVISEDISIGSLVLNDFKIESIVIEGNPCSDIFTTKFSMEKIQKEYETIQEDAQNKIKSFNLKVVTNVLTLLKPKADHAHQHVESQPLVAFPIPPTIVNDDNCHMYSELIEERLGLAHGRLKEIETKANTTQEKFELKIKNAKDGCVEQIEANLDSLQAKLDMVESHPDENSNKLNIYINSQLKNIRSKYELAKKQLFAKSSDHADTITYIKNIPQKLKNLLSTSYQYGNGIDIVPFVKECLIIALYHAALEYRIELLKDLNEKDIANQSNAKKKDFNEKFNGIADLNDVLQICSIDQAKENLSQLTPSMLEEFIHKLLQTSDDRKFFNASATQLILNQLELARAYLEKCLNFNLFEVQEKTLRKWSHASFRFTNKMVEYESRAEAVRTTFSKNDETVGYEDCLNRMSVESPDKYIDENLKKELIQIKDQSSQIILNVKFVQRLISSEQTFEQLIKPIEKNRTASDIMLDKIAKKRMDSFTSLALWNNSDLPESSKQLLSQKMSDYQKQAEDFSVELDKLVYNFDKLKRFFLPAVQPLLDNLLEGRCSATPSQDLTEISNTLRELEKISPEIEKIKEQLTRLKIEVEYGERLASHVKQIKFIIDDAYKLAHTPYVVRAKLSISEFQINVDEFYLENSRQIENFKNQLKHSRNLFNHTLPDVEKAIESDIEVKIKQLDQYQVEIQEKQKKNDIKLICHLIVNAILCCYQNEDKNRNQTHSSVDKQKSRRLISKSNPKNQYKDSRVLLDMILGDHYKGWCEDNDKACDLLIALKQSVHSQPIDHRDIPIAKLSEMLRLLSLDTQSNRTLSEISAELISFNCLHLPVYLLEQAVLDQLKFKLANQKDIADLPSSPSCAIEKTVLQFSDEDALPSPRAPKHARIIKPIDITQSSKQPGWMRRHWGKILFALLFAGIVIGGIFTAGLVPAIATLVLSLAAPTILMGPVLAASLGVTCIAVGSLMVGMGMAGLGKKLIVSREGGTSGFFKRHWGKIALTSLLVGAAVTSLFTLGGSVLIGTLAAGVIASTAALGLTISPVIASGIGGATVGAGLALGGIITGVTTSLAADCCCNRPKKMNTSKVAESSIEEGKDRDENEDDVSVPSVRVSSTVSQSRHSTDYYLNKQFENTDPDLKSNFLESRKPVLYDESIKSSRSDQHKEKKKRKAARKVKIEEQAYEKSQDQLVRRYG